MLAYLFYCKREYVRLFKALPRAYLYSDYAPIPVLAPNYSSRLPAWLVSLTLHQFDFHCHFFTVRNSAAGRGLWWKELMSYKND